MSRYIIARQLALSSPKGDHFWDDRLAQQLPHPQVFIGEPVDTGLLDGNGNKIYRTPGPVGYLPKTFES